MQQYHKFIIDNGIEKREVASTTIQSLADQIKKSLYEKYKYANNMKIYYKYGTACTNILKQTPRAVS
ncbi:MULTISPECIES: hypothetical protein [Staphylococcaceae]|uniref:Uncharacterized protein n=1 Tax=Staphylococcus equorum TaxID=246432 RepID=A0AAP7IGB3_9STAP|nr:MULTISPECIES: hypothetical protein [Staphylococcaceae]OEK59109.1 hypothetical protein ASS94_00145 [Staphylococcus equorum]